MTAAHNQVREARRLYEDRVGNTPDFAVISPSLIGALYAEGFVATEFHADDWLYGMRLIVDAACPDGKIFVGEESQIKVGDSKLSYEVLRRLDADKVSRFSDLFGPIIVRGRRSWRRLWLVRDRDKHYYYRCEFDGDGVFIGARFSHGGNV